MSAVTITLGGKTAAQLGFIFLWRDTELPGAPQTRDKTMVVGGRHGVLDFGADMEPLPFVLDLLIDDGRDFREAARDLNKFIKDGWGRPKVLTLVFSNEPDKTYYVRYHGVLGIDRTSYQRITLPLIATEPFAFGSEVEDDQTITTSPANLNYSVVSGINVPILIILDNEGANTITGFSFKTFEEIFDVVPTP